MFGWPTGIKYSCIYNIAYHALRLKGSYDIVLFHFDYDQFKFVDFEFLPKVILHCRYRIWLFEWHNMIGADSKMNTIMGRYMFEIVENCAQTVS